MRDSGSGWHPLAALAERLRTSRRRHPWPPARRAWRRLGTAASLTNRGGRRRANCRARGYDEDVENDDDMAYPPELVGDLLRAIESHDGEEPPESEHAEENNSNRNRYRPLPPRDGLRKLLDVALAASQQPEEGRFPKFSLAYVLPDGLVEKRYDVCPFAETKALTVRDVAKLAPAADPRRSYLGVSPSTETQELRIWGLIHRRKGHFESEPQGGKSAWTPSDLFLMIRVHAPGVLLVNHSSRMHLAYVRGKAYWSMPPAVLQAVLRDRADVEPDAAQAVCDVVARMGELGKGGTLLITDPSLKVGSDLLDLTYRFGSPSQMLKAAVEDMMKGGHRHDLVPPLRAALDFVADLSKVDGVVHLTSDLGVVGFGGKVMLGLPPEARLTKEDPSKLNVMERASIEDFRGMRHRSAAQFCANQMGQALAIVVSQDGDVTLVGRRDDGTVHKIGPFALAIGVAM
jgi:hypothetical protein